MNKLKIIKIVIIGSLLINLPFIFGIIYIFINTKVKDYLFYTLILSSFMLFYWSYFAPLYKYYSIKKLENNSEFEYWFKISVRGIILCPKNSYFERLECWNKRN